MEWLSKIRKKVDNDAEVRESRKKRYIVEAINMVITYLCVASGPQKKLVQPKHTSVLTGAKWIKEMWAANDSRFLAQFRMNKPTMAGLVRILQDRYGLKPFRHVAADESVAMFLQILGHGLTFPLVTERFQHSGQTVNSHFHEVLAAVCLLGDDIISPSDTDHGCVHPYIMNNAKYKDYFTGCIGAIDGCHIELRMGEVDVVAWRNRKGATSTNCFAVVDFDMCFTFAKVGIEGSMHDSRILYRALADPVRLFPVPPDGKYYLADAGFPNIKGFLTPYKGTRYHLPDFRQAGVIRNLEENFNYHHSSLRSIVERAFGLWKGKWKILCNMTRFPREVQLEIIWASMALHNWVRRHNLNGEIEVSSDDEVTDNVDIGRLHMWTPVRLRESREMNMLRDSIRDKLTMHVL